MYARRGSIVAVPFDAGRLAVTGPPVTVLQGVWTSRGTGAAGFSFSQTGDLAYVEEDANIRTGIGSNLTYVPPVAMTSVPLVWIDRSGAERAVPGVERHLYGTPHLAGDGHTAVIQIADPDSNIWAINLDRGTRSRVTSSGFIRYPIPSGDGTRVAYASYKDGRNGLFVTGMDGGGETRLTATTC